MNDILSAFGMCAYIPKKGKKGLNERIRRLKRCYKEKPEFFFQCVKQYSDFVVLINRNPKKKKIDFIPTPIEGLDNCEISFFIWDLACVLHYFKAVSYPGTICKDFMGTQVTYHKCIKSINDK